MANASPEFVILSRPRCGSQYLVSCMNTHTEVICYDELFHNKLVRYSYDGNVFLPYGKWVMDYARIPPSCSHQEACRLSLLYQCANKAGLIFRNCFPEIFLSHIRGQKEGADGRLMGFKLLTNGLQNSGLRYLAKHNASKIILLNRRNLVKQYISRILAKRNGSWFHTQESFLKQRLHINPEDMIRSISKNLKVHNQCLTKIQKAGHSCITIYYEDLFSDMDAQLKRISGFLNISPSGFTPGTVALRKQTDMDLAKVIINYEKVSAYLHKTPWHAMLLSTTL